MAELDRQRLSNRARITFNEDNYQRQYYFTFPYPVMRHIFKNADTETQLKLRQTCKFFHKMNPMIIVEELFFGRDRPQNVDKWDLYVRNFEEMPIIDVVTKRIACYSYDKRMISKILRCNAKIIWLFPESILSIEEFHYFTQSGMVNLWHSPYANIHDANGKLISLEDFLFGLPNAECVYAKVQDVTRNVSSKIVTWNNKIRNLYLKFHGPINADEFFELLKKVLAPVAFLEIGFIGLTNETYLTTFKSEMEAKMKTWKPRKETPFFSINRHF